MRWKDPTDPSVWLSLTYAGLWEQVGRLARALEGWGLGRGDRVIMLSRSRPEWVTSDLACLSLGVVTCPIFPGDPPARMVAMTRSVGARLVIAESAHLAHRFAEGWPVGANPLPTLLIEPAEGFTALAELDDAGEGPIGEWNWQAVTPESLATIVHTIGEDGVPKGVLISHANVVHSALAAAQALDVGPTDRTLSVLPLSHMFERGAGVLVLLSAGGSVAFGDRSFERWASDLPAVRPTIMACIPLFFEQFGDRLSEQLERGGLAQRVLVGWARAVGRRRYEAHLSGRPPSVGVRAGSWLARHLVVRRLHAAFGGRLRFLASGGAPLPPATAVLFEELGITILEGYGLTETAPLLTVGRPRSYRHGTVGPPIPGTELRLDPATGEVLARGPQVMSGYLDRPGDTAAAFDDEGWLRTGDIGSFDDAGRLEIIGRLKNLLVLGTGKNVAPAPIEDALRQNTAVTQAVLLGDGQSWTGALVHLEAPSHLAAIQADLDQALLPFAVHERPRRFGVLPRPLSAELGEVDAAGRPIRSAVLAHFPDEAAALFTVHRQVVPPRPK
jgi:long-chain acyl-CoA synthetase